MTDLFLDPRVLNYQDDRYELILYTLRWARQLKAKGAVEPMADLIEKALREIVEKKITKDEIMANKLATEPAPSEEAIPVVISVADEGVEGKPDVLVSIAAEEGEKKPKAKKKKKKAE